MEQMVTVSSVRLQPDAQSAQTPAARRLVELLCELSAEFRLVPEVYCLDMECSIWVRYLSAQYLCDEFLAEYGGVLAGIGRSYSIAVHGTLEGFEQGELLFILEDGCVRLERRNHSGREFSELGNIGIEVRVEDEGERAFLFELCRAVDGVRPGMAVRRVFEQLDCASELFEPDCYSRYRYVLLQGPAKPETFLACLQLRQKVELWRSFLEDSVSALEFEWLCDALESGSLTDAFEWEFALRLALSEERILILSGPEGFQVVRHSGVRLRLGYDAQAPAAEKLFLKILFPAGGCAAAHTQG